MPRFFLPTCLSLLTMSAACVAWSQSPIDVTPAQRTALGIETQIIESLGSINAVSATGHIEAPIGATQSIIAPFGGSVLETKIIPGMAVTKGQIIARLFSEDYALMQTELKQAKISAEHAEHIDERTQALFELGLRSESERDEADHEAESGLLTVQAIRTQLSRVKNAPGSGQYFVTAQHNGLISHILLNTGDSADAQQPLVRIFTGDEYWARVLVPDTKIDQIRLGTKAEFPHTGLTGDVIAIDPEVDPTSRSVEVVVALPKGVNWRLGSIITAKFDADVNRYALPIPTRAIVRLGGESFVFVESDAGFKPVNVLIQSQTAQISLVTGTISAGNSVAVSGLAALKNILEAG